ncbi:MAG: type II toxin-antitoxin system RelE/ParE family toxin [Candidatus Omnitrophica bacterium]|nr:type II toxin-antitoxin system RelE/ParE family toxin [Candidatus Omnitrophota bacterium]
MAKVIWTDRALIDLDEIADYIAIDRQGAAERLVQRIFERVEGLAEFPESGRVPPELEGSHFREVIVDPCRVFYRFKGKSIYILYIMRGERELRRYILDDREDFLHHD